MRCFQGLYFILSALAVCGVAQADTLPTLTATYANVPFAGASFTEMVSGPDFNFSGNVFLNPGLDYPCSLPAPASGCVAPAPPLFIQGSGPEWDLEGAVTLGGTITPAYFAGNAQIIYPTSTIVYPDPTPVGNTLSIPVVLSGSESACLRPDFPSADPCVGLDSFGRPLPGYPDYLANISINVPGTLTFYVLQPVPGRVVTEVYFAGTPVPEPGGVAPACIGFLILSAGYRMRRKQTS